MTGLIESAGAILSASERRLETVAHNIANVSTLGFKRQLSFVDAIAERPDAVSRSAETRTRSDLAQGRLSETGNPLDLAIAGSGFFRLRAGEATLYSRQGNFRLADDGRIVSQQGYALQAADGGDLVLDSAAVEILADGTVLDQGRPVARIALFAPAEGAAIEPLGGAAAAIPDAMVEEVAEPQLRQGMVEVSNVSLGDEMVAMMAAVRQAESGARLVQLYDELIGRAVTTFGESGR